MLCSMIGLSPNRNIGLGTVSVSGLRRLPLPPAIITASKGSWALVYSKSIKSTILPSWLRIGRIFISLFRYFSKL